MSQSPPPVRPVSEGFADKALKTVTINGKRTTIRLEQAFWDAIPLLARLRGVSAKHYLDRLAHASDDHAPSNRSGYLRALITADLIRQVHAGRMEDNDIKSVVRTAPTPAFVMTTRGELQEYNDEMAQFIRMTVSGADNTGGKKLELKFARPLSVIEQELLASAGAPALVNFTLVYGDAMTSGRARLNLVGAKKAEIRRLIGFVQT